MWWVSEVAVGCRQAYWEGIGRQGSEQEVGEVSDDHDFGALEQGYVRGLFPVYSVLLYFVS